MTAAARTIYPDHDVTGNLVYFNDVMEEVKHEQMWLGESGSLIYSLS